MDEALNALLAAPNRLEPDRASAYISVLVEAGRRMFPDLDRPSQEEWQAKLAAVEDDLEQLGEAAAKAAARFDEKRRDLETLTLVAELDGYVVPGRPASLALTGDETRCGSAPLDEDLFKDLVGRAETTRDAIVAVMSRKPQRAWTAVTITDGLARYGRPITRANVQVSLRRLATDGLVRKVDRGRYQVVSDVLTGPPGRQIPDRQAETNRKALVRRDAALKASITRARNRQVQAGL